METHYKSLEAYYSKLKNSHLRDLLKDDKRNLQFVAKF